MWRMPLRLRYFLASFGRSIRFGPIPTRALSVYFVFAYDTGIFIYIYFYWYRLDAYSLMGVGNSFSTVTTLWSTWPP